MQPTGCIPLFLLDSPFDQVVDWPTTAARRRTRGPIRRDTSSRRTSAPSRNENSGLNDTRLRGGPSPFARYTRERCPPPPYALPESDSSVSYTALPPNTPISPPIRACESTTALPQITVALRRTCPL